MKKATSLFLFLSLLASKPLFAAESKAGGLELSGNVDVVTGWQHDDKNATGIAIGGQLGEFRGATSPSRDTFDFYIDQVELDLNKSFGDNIRIRADLDFGRQLSGSTRNTNSGGYSGIVGAGGSNFELEQGYVTFNIKGLEMMFGRFNAPIGYYVVDRADNPTISFSTPFKYLTPTNVTGMKTFYSFNDHFDWHLYVVNNLADSVAFGFGPTANPGGMGNYSALPSYGTRFGFNWGSEDTKSTVGISYAGGPERFGCNAGTSSCNKHLTHIVDLDFAVKLTPKFLLAGEGVFRQDNALVAGTQSDRAFGGFALVNYDISDAWRVFFRYGFLQDRTGFYTDTLATAAGFTVGGVNVHDFALGVGYQLTEGAKVKIEYSPYITDPRAKGLKTSMSHGLAVEFAYNF
ncbi:MAG: outer membrane beta-barrel protein [Deltaproteobacteria bacterium]|nr:outer membrane beta-barrel protein [Deltaproteobacteria bacterium]